MSKAKCFLIKVFCHLILFIIINEKNVYGKKHKNNYKIVNPAIRKELTYSLSYGKIKNGISFNPLLYPYLKELKLRDIDNDYIDVEVDSIPKPVIVTAFSENHFNEALGLFKSIRRYLSNHKVVIYDIGLKKKNVRLVKKLCNVEYRRFNFSKYPKHFKILFEYAWKPIIHAEALRDFKAIWFVDASIRFTKSDLSKIYASTICRNNETGTLILENEFKSLIYSVNSDNNEILGKKRLNNNHCNKSSFLLHSPAGHGIVPATHKGMFDYFPASMNMLGSKRGEMYQSGLFYAIKTKDTTNKILKWSVLCALERNCIAPKGSTRINCYTIRKKKNSESSSRCHRYDQSIYNILLANAYNYDAKNYVSENNNFFEIKRDERGSIDETFFC
uniref:Fe/B12 periplasmic-binding domain-containing protein n=1 Tax=Parastrongyloides trichosuri TaxID=131310 RepID=A0A0N4ZQL3_PARTI